jgi:putative heme iron utilization protein
MTNKPPDSVLRPVDDDAIRLAASLVHDARHASLATLDPESGYPWVTRVLLAVVDGQPVMLLSELATHTQALIRDARCSLLCGEPAAGDPMTHPRLTLAGIAQRLAGEAPVKERIREVFLQRHPKANLYVDFADFAFWRLAPTGASLNAGFGRAYRLSADQLMLALAAAPTGL